MIAMATLEAYFCGLQKRLIAAIEAVEGEHGLRLRADPWRKDAGATLAGHGLTAIIEGGHVFERGGIAFSHVSGPALPASATAKRPELAGRAFEALGVSLVLHPLNPYCPTAHMNVRALVAGGSDKFAPTGWFGGGMDLTPYYPFEDDIRHFHGTCQRALVPFGDGVHARYKAWCDEYFYLPHRREPRGVGGIFFDDLCENGEGWDDPFERSFALTRSVGDAFADAYLPLVERRRDTPYGERERDFQAYRRGRYVEFNLVCDRGTLFGLQSGGRTESILMSLPPLVKWRYDWQPEAGSPEALIYEMLTPRDWV
jgi:coproporphyrinogen III oxidase